MNIDNGNLQFNRYQTGTIGNARPENVAANNTQTASGNAALAQAQEGQTFTGRIVDVNGSQVTIQMDGNMMLQARMAEAVNLNMGDTIAFLVKENSENTVMIQPLASDMQAMKDQTIFDLLEKNQLSPSDKNYQIAETLLNLIFTCKCYNSIICILIIAVLRVYRPSKSRSTLHYNSDFSING